MRQSYRFELAKTTAQIRAYFELRYEIFCREQQLFQGRDWDEIDRFAHPIVALTNGHNYHPDLVPSEQVVGVVRIYEPKPRVWYGGRLGVHPAHRRGWRMGKGLIQKAVMTANEWGCDQFLATVQLQNVRFFQRLHWHSLKEITICDRPHHLMEADLAHYPPNGEPRPPSVPQLFEVA
ncbi:MAG: MSMEG_0567/Sll0786 family nitrogen starvation N-acetyltransferase [Cyanobacteria bacterium P01_G01_bin.54]